jgi:5-methylthioadenosine/S-adenosylhomocysteine deaminase
MADILIKNGFIATMDHDGNVYRRGNVYIRDDRILAVGDTSEIDSTPDEILDADNKVVLPGFVNTHSHLQQYFRGLYEQIGEFYEVNLPMEQYRQPEDMDYLAMASCAEYIHSGCTTSVVIYTYPDGFAKAIAKSGVRSVLAVDIDEVNLESLRQGTYVYDDEKGEAAFQRALDLYDSWHGAENGRITTLVAPKAADLTRPVLFKKCKDFAEKNQLRMTTHLSQSTREYKQVMALYGKTPPQHLHELGVLDENLMAAHCVYATEADLELIRSAGSPILQCRFLHSPFVKWKDMGIPIALGTDDFNHDMLQLIRENLMGQSFRAGLLESAEQMFAEDRVTSRPYIYEMLELATRKGAEAIGMDKDIGSLEVGKKADLITIDLENPFLLPTNDPLTSVVLYAASSDIDNVMVDGKLVKKDRVFTTFNPKQAYTDAQKRVGEIRNKLFKDHPHQKDIWLRKAPYMEE